MTQQKIQLAFFFSLLVIAGGFAVAMFLPFVTTVVLAAILAVVLQPVYKRLLVMFRGQQAFAALVSMLAGALIVLVPITLFGLRIFKESADLYAELNNNQNWLTHIANDIVFKELLRILPGVKIDLNDIMRQAVAWLVGNLGGLFTGTVQSLIHGFIGTIALYYLLKDGAKLKQILIHYSPLPDQYDYEIYGKLTKAIRSIMQGTLLIALIQGLFTGIGLAFFGVPNATLWGSVASVCSLIPGLGTSLVFIPSVVFLYLSGETASAIGLTLWATLAVGLIDNILGPSLVGRGVRIHPFFVLMSVVSGIGLFGATGFIFGPLLLSFLFALVDIYRLLILREKVKH